MMSLLFALFLAIMVLALMNREKLSLIVFGVALAASLFWFGHHASSSLAIQL